MKTFAVKCIALAVAVIVISTLTGCTNWKKKYQGLDVEYQNVKGLYETCTASLDSSAAEKAKMSQEMSQSKQTIDQLQKQIQQGKAADKATGFEGLDVSVDAKAGTITVTLPQSILFASGSATLKNASISELDQVYDTVRERYSGRSIDIVGHTDTDPIRKTKDKWQDNWELSAERSLTVVRYLVNHGIAPANIRAVGCGEARPVASNSSSSGKAKNRRVEIVVHMR